jgi:hypothetical protein
MTIAAYARKHGVAWQTIKAKIDRGVITPKALVRVGPTEIRILSEVADQEMIANSDVEQTLAQNAGKHGKVTNAVRAGLQGLTANTPPGTTVEERLIAGEMVPVTEIPFIGDSNLEQFQKAKTTTEINRARKIELEVAEMEGKLLDAGRVKAAITKHVSNSKSALLNLPGRVAPVLAGMTNVIEIENYLMAEINETLSALSKLEK